MSSQQRQQKGCLPMHALHVHAIHSPICASAFKVYIRRFCNITLIVVVHNDILIAIKNFCEYKFTVWPISYS